MIIPAAVPRSDFKKIYANIAKKLFAIFSHAYQLNHLCYGLKIYPDLYYPVIKKLSF